jgi:hypothetical protein
MNKDAYDMPIVKSNNGTPQNRVYDRLSKVVWLGLWVHFVGFI